MKKTFYPLLVLFIICGILLGTSGASGYYLDSEYFGLKIKVEIEKETALEFKLTWPEDIATYETLINRKLFSEDFWTPLDTLSGSTFEYVDRSIERGVPYEYKIEKRVAYKDTADTSKTNYYDIFGYVSVGVEIPGTDYEGRLLILVDETLADPLEYEIDRYSREVWLEGFTPVVKTVPRAETFDSEKVERVKQIIKDEFYGSPDSLSHVVLFGRAPVPYSGKIAPDGHAPDHYGAWAASTYYGDVDGAWTDTSVSYLEAADPRNWNDVGDGKFDQIEIPSDLDLAVGTVDLYDLPFFENTSEINLLKRYFAKNSDFRRGRYRPRLRGAVDDKFNPNDYSEKFAGSAWMNFSALFGPDAADSVPQFQESLENESYIWAYGSNGGAYTSVMHVAYPDRFRDSQVNAVFTMLFGSYLGDWDSRDNIMRCALASRPSILTCNWGSRPNWHLHRMAFGETIGETARLSQNNKYLYRSQGLYGFRYVHTGLLGDPTLKLHVPLPPENLRVERIDLGDSGAKAKLIWDYPAGEDAFGFNVYRAEEVFGKLEKLTPEPIADKFYVDSVAPGGYVYVVRPVMYEIVPTGEFYNVGPGAATELDAPRISKADLHPGEFVVSPNPATDYVRLSFEIAGESRVKIEIFDMLGKKIKTLRDREFKPGEYAIFWNLDDEDGSLTPSGLYFLRIKIGDKITSRNIVITR